MSLTEPHPGEKEISERLRVGTVLFSGNSKGGSFNER